MQNRQQITNCFNNKTEKKKNHNFKGKQISNLGKQNMAMKQRLTEVGFQ